MAEQHSVDVPVERINGSQASHDCDRVAVEEPLEIRLAYGTPGKRTCRNITVTLRTPGQDKELAAGFLLTEGIVRRREDIEAIRHCGPAAGPLGLRNVLRVDLSRGVVVDLARLERNFVSTSSCGVCGKASLEALGMLPHDRLPDGFTIGARRIHELPARLRRAQSVFDRTGGLHAAALFDRDGRLCELCEDIGRHNAVDKVIGRQFLDGVGPPLDRLIFVSGRAGYELVQKALAAGIPMLAAVGAPSSLAVEIARECNMALLGFVRDGRFNVYSAPHRISGAIGDAFSDDRSCAAEPTVTGDRRS